MKNYQPLVSIVIPNYNHSMYLDEAIQSALNQTYKNIEVIISDNCSQDHSVEVMMKYLDQGVTVIKNPINLFNSNYILSSEASKGEYLLLLCADDCIKPEFVQKAVEIMEENRNIGFVHCERDYIDKEGTITRLDPFFNCSFWTQGKNMLPIFMLTDVGASAQALVRRSKLIEIGGHDSESDHLNIDREKWFRLAMITDYAYIREKLALIRIPEGRSETSKAVEIFYHPLALFHTIKSFEKWALLRDYKEVSARVRQAEEKLATECGGFITELIGREEFDLARKYLLFMQLLNPSLLMDQLHMDCMEMCIQRDNTKIREEKITPRDNYTFRKRNYEPPESFELLENVEEGNWHA
ncbi:MAG: glycosyltransferase family 2 protein [Lachnospiraceae bacterium]